MTAKAVWALTARGDQRHIHVPPAGQYGLYPDSTAVCGKLLRLRLRGQWWSRLIPRCRDCRRVR